MVPVRLLAPALWSLHGERLGEGVFVRPDETPNKFDANLLRTDDPTQCSKYSKTKRKRVGTLIFAN